MIYRIYCRDRNLIKIYKNSVTVTHPLIQRGGEADVDAEAAVGA